MWREGGSCRSGGGGVTDGRMQWQAGERGTISQRDEGSCRMREGAEGRSSGAEVRDYLKERKRGVQGCNRVAEYQVQNRSRGNAKLVCCCCCCFSGGVVAVDVLVSCCC